MRTTRFAALCLLFVPLTAFSASGAEKYDAIKVAQVNPVKPAEDLKAFLGKLAAAAKNKDRKKLAAYLAKDFFWQRDFGGGFDPKASAARNFENALSLNEADLEPEYKDIGWERLRELLAVDSFSPNDRKKQVICGPAVTEPVDRQSAEKIAQRFDTTLDFDWVYVEEGPAKVYAEKGGKGGVVAQMSWQAVRVLDWGDENGKADGPPTPLEWLKVHLPGGEVGYVAYGQTVSFLSDRLCYGKDAKGNWRIAGYVGGGD